ncbi:uncharacterized protein [Rutidosis leptorrhynchoides]|uniref:uncharacterized protein n=1 Tax=Rutidosis leptorrhynchoides TaxID=125765 RepID=UPI003A9A06ED
MQDKQIAAATDADSYNPERAKQSNNWDPELLKVQFDQRSKKQQTSTSTKASIEVILSEFQIDSPSLTPHYKEYRWRLTRLMKKQFEATWVVNWDPLIRNYLYIRCRGMLRQLYLSQNGNSIRSSYQDWDNLLDEDHNPIYQKLCWEFHSTYFLKENPESMDDKDFMRFRLGCVDRRMSLLDFTKCLKIYSPEEMGEKYFSDYIWSGARVSSAITPNGEDDFFDASKVWEEFRKRSSSVSSRWSNPEGMSVLDVDDVGLRFLHLVLTHSFTHRTEDTNKVTLSDLWFMKKIGSKHTRVCIPYCVAYYLKNWATGVVVDPNSPICGGHFVTLIAHHLGVKCDPASELTLERRTISCRKYLEANVIHYLYPEDEEELKKEEEGLKKEEEEEEEEFKKEEEPKEEEEVVVDSEEQRGAQPEMISWREEIFVQPEGSPLRKRIEILRRQLDKIVKRHLKQVDTLTEMIQDLKLKHPDEEETHHHNISLRLADIVLQLKRLS